MWKVVGFKARDGKNGRYYDLYLEREATHPAQGKEVMSGDYAAARVSYVPVIGDWVVVSMDSFNGRRYIADVIKVK